MAAPLSVLGMVFAIFQMRDTPQPRLGAVVMAILGMAYGLGGVIQANCLLDDGPSTRHKVEVLSKEARGKHNNEYYIAVTAWADREDGNEVQVSREHYDRAEEGSNATVHVMPGALAVRWFVATVDSSSTE